MSHVALRVGKPADSFRFPASRWVRRRSLLHAGFWIGLFIVNVFGILPWRFVKFPVVDLGDMVYQVRRLQLGYVPYRDTFTHHFLGYVAPFYLLGAFTPLTPTVLLIANVGFHFATAVLVFLALRELTRVGIAWLGAFLAVSFGWFSGWQGFAFNVQAYLVPLLALELLFLVVACTREAPRAFYAAALVGGLLVTFDQRSAAFMPLILVPPLFICTLRRLRTAATAAAAFAIAPLLCAIYLIRMGAWNDFVQQTFVFPIYYRNRGLDAASTGGINLLPFWFDVDPAAALLTAVGLVLVWARDGRAWLKTLLLLAVLGAAAYALAGGRFYNNYFLLFAPATLLIVALLPAEFTGRSISAKLSILLLTMLGILGAARPFRGGLTRDAAVRRDATIVGAAAFLRSHTGPADGVLVWGFAPQIYVLGDRFNAFRDAGLMSVAGANFTSTSPAAQGRMPGMVAEFDRYLRKTPPKAIVVYRLTPGPTDICQGLGLPQRNLDYNRAPNLRGLRELIAAQYRLRYQVQGSCDRAEIFMRSETSSAL